MCPYAQKAWIALESAGIPYDMREVSLYGPLWRDSIWEGTRGSGACSAGVFRGEGVVGVVGVGGEGGEEGVARGGAVGKVGGIRVVGGVGGVAESEPKGYFEHRVYYEMYYP